MRRQKPLLEKGGITEAEFPAKLAEGPSILTKGAAKYPDVAPDQPNWTLAEGEQEYRRFKESAYRHFMQLYYGERDEDHAAAVFFNVSGAEYVQGKTNKNL